MQPLEPTKASPCDAEARISVITDVISRVLRSPAPVLYKTLFQSVMEATGRAEEDVGQEISAAICVAIFSGLFWSESHVCGEFHVTSETTLRPSRWATRFVWRDEYFGPSPDDEPPDRIA